MTQQLSDADLDERLVELVNQWWAEHGKPLLLSQLGGYDNGKLGAAIKGKARNLATYIETRLSDRVRVIRHEERPQVVGVVPADAEVARFGGATALLERTGNRPIGSVRFHRAFWAAFRQPLTESQRRYINLRAPVHFQDVPIDDPQPENSTEVDSAYIVDTEDEVEVQGKINEWLAANGLDSAAFAVSKEQESKPLPANDLLGRLLGALDPDQLARINMPLDVVDRLRRQAL